MHYINMGSEMLGTGYRSCVWHLLFSYNTRVYLTLMLSKDLADHCLGRTSFFNRVCYFKIMALVKALDNRIKLTKYLLFRN